MDLAYILKYLNLILEDNKIVYKNDLLNETERDNQNEEKCNLRKSINDISNR